MAQFRLSKFNASQRRTMRLKAVAPLGSTLTASKLPHATLRGVAHRAQGRRLPQLSQTLIPQQN